MITSDTNYAKTYEEPPAKYLSGSTWLSESQMPPTIRSKRFSEAGSLIWSRRIFEEQKEDPEEIIPPIPRRLFRLVNLSIPAISSFALMLL